MIGIPTFWAPQDKARDMLRYLKTETERPYRMLYDLTAIDERVRNNREDQPVSDFTVVYHLLSFERNEDVRIKVALAASALHCKRSPTSGPRPTGTSAKCGTCSASPSPAIRI